MGATGCSDQYEEDVVAVELHRWRFYQTYPSRLPVWSRKKEATAHDEESTGYPTNLTLRAGRPHHSQGCYLSS